MPTRQELVQAADSTLRELLRILPLAHANGRLESWASLYTHGLMLKLRAMK
jgi:hypothetical protein